MIDLNHTREQMLAEIKASEKAFANCMHDPADPGFIALVEARLIVQGKTPEDLLPILNVAFSKRFADIPSEQLFHDLIHPLKKGLGNAYKWGNHKDPAKWITVEAVVTNRGALVAISDEGEGFDAKGILGQFRSGEHYFAHGGSGFTHFDRAKSLISYANGGRTLLIRFLCVPEPGRALTATESAALGMAGNQEFMKSLLAAELPCFRKNKATLEACRIYVPDKLNGAQSEIKYVLEYRKGKSEKVKEVTLAGRLLPESAAQTDFSVAKQLYQGPFKGNKDIHIPKPVAALKQPPMTLFKFNPAMDLREYVKKIFNFPKLAYVIRRVAGGLLALHQSAFAFEVNEGLEETLERRRAAGKRIVTKLAQVSPQRVERAHQIFNRFEERAAGLKGCELAPIHGAFGWNCILYGDEKFYFYRFDKCRRSHPGFDVGGFLADLLRFYVLRKKGDKDFYYAGRNVFLETYFAGNPPPWRDDVPFFIASAMLLHLDRLLAGPAGKWEPEVDALLEQCERLLT
jgi:hypothetical protein